MRRHRVLRASGGEKSNYTHHSPVDVTKNAKTIKRNKQKQKDSFQATKQLQITLIHRNKSLKLAKHQKLSSVSTCFNAIDLDCFIIPFSSKINESKFLTTPPPLPPLEMLLVESKTPSEATKCDGNGGADEIWLTATTCRERWSITATT